MKLEVRHANKIRHPAYFQNETTMAHHISPVHGSKSSTSLIGSNIVILHNPFYGYLQGLFNILYYGIMENLPIATIPLVMGTLLFIISAGCFEILGVLTAALKTTAAM